MELEKINLFDLKELKYKYTGMNYATAQIWKNEKSYLLLDEIKNNDQVFNIYHKYKIEK